MPNWGRTPPTRKPKRLLAWAFFALMLGPTLITPMASAYHTLPRTDGTERTFRDSVATVFNTIPSENDTRNATSTYPTFDEAREHVLATQRRAVAQLNEYLGSVNLPETSFLPIVPGRVLKDPIDTPGRIGGVGDWKLLTKQLSPNAEGGWRRNETGGFNTSAGFMMTDGATGRYGTIRTLLVTPALDLSAYALNTGTLPFVTGTTGDAVPAPAYPCGLFPRSNQILGPFRDPCDEAWALTGTALDPTIGRARAPRLVQDQVNLIFRHRYNFPEGKDGGQVYLFTREPQTVDAPGALLHPFDAWGSYTQDVAALKGHGFSGSADWSPAAFDLSRWAGKRIWVGFLVETHPFASIAGEGHFYGIPDNAPYGWSIDDIEVVAPAYPTNVKVYDIIGPTARANVTDKISLVAPNSQADVGAFVLNAGSLAAETRVHLTVLGLPGEIRAWDFKKRLEPGETWAPTTTLDLPPQAGFKFTVSAEAWIEGPVGTRTPEPPGDNTASREFLVSSFRRLETSLSVGRVMLDENEGQTATGTIRNTGNVPVSATVQLNETYFLPNATTHQRTIRGNESETRQVTLSPGDTAVITWSPTTQALGAHRIWMNTTSLAGFTTTQADYYVRSAPLPSFAADATMGAGPGWERRDMAVPIPEQDGWYWRASGTDGAVLTANTLPEVVGSGERFEALRLSARHWPAAEARVELAYSSMASVRLWSVTIPKQLSYGRPIITWIPLDSPVDVSEYQGYMDAWSAGMLQLRVVVPNVGQDSFSLDDLRLSGVPAGADETHRRDLIRITGSPEEPWVTAGTGWGRVNGTAARITANAVSKWTQAPKADPLGGPPSVWRYPMPTHVRPADVLLTPSFRLSGATSARLVLDHAYAFLGYPDDRISGSSATDPPRTCSKAAPCYEVTMAQMAQVYLQYRREDGAWSEAIHLRPLGGYVNPIAQNPEGIPRSRVKDGFFWPENCQSDAQPSWNLPECARRHYLRNFVGSEWWLMQFLPTPHREISVFDLTASTQVDLRDREVRLTFYVDPVPGPTLPEDPEVGWTLYSMRVYPTAASGIDGSVTNIQPVTPYNWTRLGLGADTVVPLQVTVKNEGTYREEFRLNVSATRLSAAATNYLPEVSVGDLAPGENRSILIPWQTPHENDPAPYRVQARIRPANPSIPDENPFNDVATLSGGHEPCGSPGTLCVSRVVDIGLVAQGFPERSEPGVLRHLPVTLYNRGNVPVRDVAVERRVERILGSQVETMEKRVWHLMQPLVADPAGIQLVRAGGGARDGEMVFEPQGIGTYIVNFHVSINSEIAKLETNLNDNSRRITLVAEPSLFRETFEAPGFGWVTSDPSVWTDGPGFRSGRGIAAINQSSGLLPTNLDAWIVSPRLPVATAQAAIVNFVTRYELEQGYDGGVIEISTDNRTWQRVTPSDAAARTQPYPAELVHSNPLASGSAPDAPVAAFSGSSASREVHLEGWAPVSINLAAIPEISEAVVARSLPAPASGGTLPTPVNPARRDLLVAPWMNLGTEVTQRWEVWDDRVCDPRDAGLVACDIPRLWSGLGSMGATISTSINQTFNVAQVPMQSALVLTWWDRRPGNDVSWLGVGGVYEVRSRGGTNPFAAIPNATIEVIGQQGSWYQLRAIVPSTSAATVEIQFRYTSTSTAVSNQGWEVRGIRVAAHETSGGVALVSNPPIMDISFAAACTPGSLAKWVPSSSPWICRDRPGDPSDVNWQSWPGLDPSGQIQDQWILPLGGTSNIRTRLVTPEVDLAQIAGGRVSLRLTHSFNLLWKEDGGTSRYEAGIVEIQVFDRVQGEWVPGGQLFANGIQPSTLLSPRPQPGSNQGAPYPHTLAEAGDAFEKFPRTLSRKTSAAQHVFVQNFDSTVSFAFAGNSRGYQTDEFNLAPFLGERVRFVFHAWTGPNASTAQRHWTIAAVDVIGTVVGTSDVWVRFRIGTDGSVQDGTWQIDDFELVGRRNERSVGIHFDQNPQYVGLEGRVRASGQLRNYGPTNRGDLAVAIRVEPPLGAPPLEILPGEGMSRIDAPGSGYTQLLGPFVLGPAGTDASTATFEFLILGARASAAYKMTAFLVEPGDGRTYRPVADDVPGRTRREWTVTAIDRRDVSLTAIQFEPSYLESPGGTTATALGRNTGTVKLNLSAVLTWRHVETGDIVGDQTITVGDVAPDAPFTFSTGTLWLTSEGNYTLDIVLLDEEISFSPPVQARGVMRVARSGIAHATNFEPLDIDGWMIGRAVQRSTEQARFGNASLLLGVSDAEYGGLPPRRLQSFQDEDLVVTSPIIDLRAATEDADLTYWYTSRMGATSSVRIWMRIPGECGWQIVSWQSVTPLQPQWTQERLPLSMTICGLPLIGRQIQIRFTTHNAMDQGWRLDGVTIASGALTTLHRPAVHELVDGARKEYPFVLRNDGVAPREVNVSLDLRESRLSKSQARWVHIEPHNVTLAPGQTVWGKATVETPPTRGAFPQALRLAISTVDSLLPFRPSTIKVDLDFRPARRADLAIATSVNGAPGGTGRVPLQEGLPHELSAVVSNVGDAASRATDIVLLLREDRTGRVVWSLRTEVEALSPILQGGEAALVTGTWTPEIGRRGNFTLTAVVDPDRRETVYDRGITETRLALAIIPLIRPDLSADVGSLRITSPDGRQIHEARPGELIRISGSIDNQGRADATQVAVRISAGATILKEEIVDILRPGERHLIQATQLAPSTTTTYRLTAITPQVELRNDNNEVSVELPVVPPDIAFQTSETPIAIDPGAVRLLSVEVRNAAPYPASLTLQLAGTGAPFATISPTWATLGPGERTNVTLRLAPHPGERPGERLLVLRADGADGLQTRQTLPVHVEPRATVSLVTLSARGPPQEIQVSFEVANTGNIRLTPRATLVGPDGVELATHDLAAMSPGTLMLSQIPVRLPDETPPGRLDAWLVVTDGDSEVGRSAVPVDVLPWGRVRLVSQREESVGAGRVAVVEVAFEGNAPALGEPRLTGVPRGVTARFTENVISLMPGGQARVELHMHADSIAPPGHYLLHVGFAGAEGRLDPGGLMVTSIPLDLRRPALQLSGFERLGTEPPRHGDVITYAARVRNLGELATNNASVNLYADGYLADQVLVDSLGPGDVRDIRLEVVARVGAMSIFAAADQRFAIRSDDQLAFAEVVHVEGAGLVGVVGSNPTPGTDILAVLMGAVAATMILRGWSRRRN